jgi:hypothetical protein
LVAIYVGGGLAMGDGTFVKKSYRGEGGVIDTEVATGTKNADPVPEVHKRATEEKVMPVPTPPGPKFFEEDEPRRG